MSLFWKSHLILCCCLMPSIAGEKPEGRRLALLVGVGDYAQNKLDLGEGPSNDVVNMKRVLTTHYGFTVKTLLDRQATRSGFTNAFHTFLGQARSEDQVVVYFSGHGSQVCDRNGDEEDGFDETLVFHDSRVAGVGDLVDDEFNEMLASLRAGHVVVILDACNSGTGRRETTGHAKWARDEDCERVVARKEKGFKGEKSPSFWIGKNHSSGRQIVGLFAARDGQVAIIREKTSVFTDALVSVLSQLETRSLTYEQLSMRVKARVSSFGQEPVFDGDLDRLVFSRKRSTAIGWMVNKQSEEWTVSGVPLPGWSNGTVVAIYRAGSRLEQMSDPKAAVMKLVLEDVDKGFGYFAEPEKGEGNLAQLEIGDRAILIRPGSDLFRLTVCLKSAGERGGIPTKRANALKQAIGSSLRLKGLVQLVDGKHADFELDLDHAGDIRVLGPQRLLRVRISASKQEAEDVSWNLWLHAVQKHLLIQRLPKHRKARPSQ